MSRVYGVLIGCGVLTVLMVGMASADPRHLADDPLPDTVEDVAADGQSAVTTESDKARQQAEEGAAEAQEQATKAQEQVATTPGRLTAIVADAGERITVDGTNFFEAAMGMGLDAARGLADLVVNTVYPPQEAPENGAHADPKYASQGNGAIVTPVQGDAALALIVAAGAAGAALLWVTVLQRTVLFGLVPLLSRIAHSEIYTNDARRLIGDMVSQSPGISLNEIVQRTGYSRNAVSYHLFVLEKEEELVSVKDGKYRRYFTRGGKYVNGAKNVVSVLRNEVTLKIAQRIASQPGTIQRDLCVLVGTTPSAVCWHIKRLEESNVVRKQRVANTVQYYPGEALSKYDLSEFGLAAAPLPPAPQVLLAA